MTRWIRTTGELEKLVSDLQGCRVLALDSESDSLHHHKAKVCLVQAAGDNGVEALIDPLGAIDMSPLAPVIAEPAVTKVFHGADYDVTTMKRDFGYEFASVFDTMIASRFLGLAEIGLQALARAELGVLLSKDSQKDDWSRRPLTPVQEAYALADVQHLVVLQDRLAGRLREIGRASWVAEECDAVAALEPARKGSDPLAWQRVKGIRRLSRRQLAIFHALHTWREGLGDATDIPTYKLLSTETMFALAEQPPAGPAELAKMKGLSPRIRTRSADILQVVREALALPEKDCPLLPTVPRPQVSDATRARIDALRTWRAAEAVRQCLDVSVVLPQRLLDKVAEQAPRTKADLALVEGIRSWRVEAFGDALLREMARFPTLAL